MPRLRRSELSALVFIVPANIFYSIAALTHAWFEIPPHSCYGLWWAKFCDVLRCQLIPAFYTEEPSWYHLVQSVSMVAWICIVLSLISLVTGRLDKYLPIKSSVSNRQTRVAALCLVSVFAISTSLILFYMKLKESSPEIEPEISWSSILAALSCLCQLCAGLILLKACELSVF
ncbi:hypothetical protein LOTGIDRAFT_232455 [Lottia gigantea]|uniref:Uncharacterized protein n=1 Tax=Lottia gigantea TaxID=225164 RepID=V4AGA2_LOTGI|nr:hypothetical protein LOTGIDRAFT_232455 [Lottia gigantea]ESO94195.1 hypothetical protein LOTGIDRAFT_232455 [Lottia gigantea]